MPNTAIAERYLVVYQKDGTRVYAHADDASKLEEALDQFMGVGASRFTESEEKDSFVHLRPPHGVGFGWRVLASSVNTWGLSTPEERRADLLFDNARAAEAARFSPAPPQPTTA